MSAKRWIEPLQAGKLQPMGYRLGAHQDIHLL